jgi:hypothetical protein
VPSCSATRDPRRDNGSRSVRGRQSASPRIAGGLVSHDQAKRSRARPDGIRDRPTGSKRAAIRVAWPACSVPSALGSHEGRKLTWRRPTAAWCPEAAIASGADPPGHRRSVRGGIGSGLCDDRIVSTTMTTAPLAWRRRSRGNTWGGLRSSPSVERENGRLKDEWALLLRVRRIERVALHADLTILCRLACALAKARTLPLAAYRLPFPAS